MDASTHGNISAHGTTSGHGTISAPGSTAAGPAAAADEAIVLEGLGRDFTIRSRTETSRRRRRTTLRAVDDLSLTIPRGEAVGFVGANGAGKSTTIKMMTGILRPTRGTVRVLGHDPVPERRHLARRIGVVFGQRSQLWWDLPLRDSYRILAAMHRMSDAARDARLERLEAGLGLGSYWERPVRQLSLGQRMRGEVAAALLHSPELVILDEPTIGLDMVSREGLRRFLREDRAERGTTLFLTTHDMTDVERLCERIVVIDAGAVAYDGALDRFRETLGAPRELIVDLTAARTSPLELPAGAEFTGVEAEGIRHRVRFSGEQLTVPALLARIGEQAEIADLSLTEPAIEDLVREISRR